MLEGWKCSEWIWRYNTFNWFCKTICPFGRNETGISCKQDQQMIISKLK